MRRADLIKRLREVATSKDEELLLVREGARHTIYRVGDRQVSVPRHREINDLTAQGILKAAEGAGQASAKEK